MKKYNENQPGPRPPESFLRTIRTLRSRGFNIEIVDFGDEYRRRMEELTEKWIREDESKRIPPTPTYMVD